jgi:hypothetical protein
MALSSEGRRNVESIKIVCKRDVAISNVASYYLGLSTLRDNSLSQ